MKEHPILFSTEMVKAILDGSKTQTRRVIKPQPWDMDKAYFKVFRKDFGERVCPYEIGDHLWVRETWWPSQVDLRGVYYKADGVQCKKWRPSIFMPRWVSRITLEVTGLKVERIQEITEEDAKAEGVPIIHTEIEDISWYRPSFATLWDSLNAKRVYSWESNPWVQVITFKCIEGVAARMEV